ncbi:MAG TPA: DUF3098 domain-containing protein [Chitinophagaceae bacterium]|jgi:hypothetical protein|nr:DUF3098 domain-containing protein [Chitinophagaceae bacterium]
MSAKTVKKDDKPTSKHLQPGSMDARFPFTKENYKIMIIGLIVIIIGYALMVGGRSPDPNQFYPDQVYSWRRITLAPIVIILGFLVEVYAIMKRPKAEKEIVQ